MCFLYLPLSVSVLASRSAQKTKRVFLVAGAGAQLPARVTTASGKHGKVNTQLVCAGEAILVTAWSPNTAAPKYTPSEGKSSSRTSRAETFAVGDSCSWHSISRSGERTPAPLIDVRRGTSDIVRPRGTLAPAVQAPLRKVAPKQDFSRPRGPR